MSALQIVALVSLVLLAVGTVLAMVSGPLCPCGCGRAPGQHSPLRRF